MRHLSLLLILVVAACASHPHSGYPTVAHFQAAPPQPTALDDEHVLEAIHARLLSTQRRLASPLALVEIDVVDQRVLLRGLVQSARDRGIIEDVVASVDPYLVIDDHELELAPDVGDEP